MIFLDGRRGVTFTLLLKAAAETSEDALPALLELAGVKSLDRFEFSAYISFAVLLRRRKNAWRLLTRGIAAGRFAFARRVFSDLLHDLFQRRPRRPAFENDVRHRSSRCPLARPRSCHG